MLVDCLTSTGEAWSTRSARSSGRAGRPTSTPRCVRCSASPRSRRARGAPRPRRADPLAVRASRANRSSQRGRRPVDDIVTELAQMQVLSAATVSAGGSRPLGGTWGPRSVAEWRVAQSRGWPSRMEATGLAREFSPRCSRPMRLRQRAHPTARPGARPPDAPAALSRDAGLPTIAACRAASLVPAVLVAVVVTAVAAPAADAKRCTTAKDFDVYAIPSGYEDGTKDVFAAGVACAARSTSGSRFVYATDGRPVKATAVPAPDLDGEGEGLPRRRPALGADQARRIRLRDAGRERDRTGARSSRTTAERRSRIAERRPFLQRG